MTCSDFYWPVLRCNFVHGWRQQADTHVTYVQCHLKKKTISAVDSQAIAIDIYTTSWILLESQYTTSSPGELFDPAQLVSGPVVRPGENGGGKIPMNGKWMKSFRCRELGRNLENVHKIHMATREQFSRWSYVPKIAFWCFDKLGSAICPLTTGLIPPPNLMNVSDAVQ